MSRWTLAGAACVVLGAFILGFGLGVQVAVDRFVVDRPVTPEDFRAVPREQGLDCLRNGRPVRCDKGLEPEAPGHLIPLSDDALHRGNLP